MIRIKIRKKNLKGNVFENVLKIYLFPKFEVSCEMGRRVYLIIHLLDHDLVVLLVLSKAHPLKIQSIIIVKK